MRDLEQSIAEWCQNLLVTPGISRETVDELESHLRDAVEQLTARGLTETEAFQQAVSQLGHTPTIAFEFQKLDTSIWWPVKIIVGLDIVAAVLLGLLCLTQFDRHPSGFLLMTHVFTITMGYVSTLLLGGLGICYVTQRIFSPLSPPRLQALTRAGSLITAVAAWFTITGVILGMAWAKAEWGRYWAWDAKETGGLAVIMWLLATLSVYHLRNTSAHTLLIASLVGNIVVGLAWFGPGSLQSGSGSNLDLLLLCALFLHLIFILAGLLPAGWLRLRKA